MEKKIMYSNSAMMGMTQYDVNIKFGLVQNEPGEETDSIRVMFSPQHAKALLMAFAETVKQYEEIFGEIPNPPSPEKMMELTDKFSRVRDVQ